MTKSSQSPPMTANDRMFYVPWHSEIMTQGPGVQSYSFTESFSLTMEEYHDQIVFLYYYIYNILLLSWPNSYSEQMNTTLSSDKVCMRCVFALCEASEHADDQRTDRVVTFPYVWHPLPVLLIGTPRPFRPSTWISDTTASSLSVSGKPPNRRDPLLHSLSKAKPRGSNIRRF